METGSGVLLVRLAQRISGVSLSFAERVGENDRLFGSVTNHDIADALKAAGYDVAKQQVRMPFGPIKTVSESTVQVALHTDVVVDVNVTGVATATNLDLSVGHTETGLKVADVTEMANTPAGYTVSVTSANLTAGGRCASATAGQVLCGLSGSMPAALKASLL